MSKISQNFNMSHANVSTMFGCETYGSKQFLQPGNLSYYKMVTINSSRTKYFQKKIIIINGIIYSRYYHHLQFDYQSHYTLAVFKA